MTLSAEKAEFRCGHYSDTAWASWHLKQLETQLFDQQLLHANNKWNIKALYD